MVTVKVQTMFVKIHVFGHTGGDVRHKFLHGREHRSLCVRAVCSIGVRLDIILVNVAQQRVEQPCTSIEI